MLKPSFVVQTTALLSSCCLVFGATAQNAEAVAFDQKEIDQNRVIAVAVPLAQSNRYNLLILEQLSNARLCWQAKDGAPGVIEPLLLQFDFTNICGRSTDSNGYSIRIAGQDRGIDYRLSIVNQGDHLSLLGVPQKSGDPVIEVARTEALGSGLLKLTLNPEWRFTRRSYQGKVLGHIYLTRDDQPSGGSFVATRSTSDSQTRTASSGSARMATSSLSLPPRLNRSLSRPSAYQSGGVSITAPIQIPVPPPEKSSFRSALLAPPSLPTGAMNSVPTLAPGLLPVPSATIPMGTAGNEPDLITASTPGLNLTAMAPGFVGQTASVFQMAVVPNFRYRVFVKPANSSQQQMVKSLVPDAFRSSYHGQSVLQVGAFQDRTKADEVIGLLNKNGIDSILSEDR